MKIYKSWFQLKSLVKRLQLYTTLGLLAFLLTTGMLTTRIHPVAVALARGDIEVQAQQNYQAGRYSEAAILWQQAVKTNFNPLNQAISLNQLAKAYQKLGKLPEAQKAIADSIKVLSNQPQDNIQKKILAQSLTTRGQIEQVTGNSQDALETWKQATVLYREIGDDTGIIGNRINQAIALQSLGFFYKASEILERVNEQLQTQPDAQLKATGLRNLGRTLERVGDLLTAEKILEQSLTISRQIGTTDEVSIALINLGNVAINCQQDNRAIAYYREAAETANNNVIRVQAQLNQLSLLIGTRQWEGADLLLPEIQSNLSALPPSRPSIYARVNLADSLMKMKAEGTETAKLLAIAIQQAREISDSKAEAFALTQLGQLYSESRQWEPARQLTETALQIAEGINAEDIIARASWQLGRLLKQTGDKNGAIAAYTNAFNTLQSLRNDLIAINPNIQFSFRDRVEPVYRQFVGLLLEGDPVPPENLQRAREVIEALQLAQIENFLRETCLDKYPEPVQLEEIDPHAAVIYPIILSDRLEVIVSIGDRLQRHTVNLPQQDVESILQQLYSAFIPGYPLPQYQQKARQVYDWLIRPLETQLVENQIKTLVFVPDGFLRNIPMTALYDGQHYLLEKYAVALSPGLQLLPNKLEGIPNHQLRTLLAGVSEARQGFEALPGVKRELHHLNRTLKTATVLLDRQFTESAFNAGVTSTALDLIHLATHGQFGSTPEETFLLAYDDKINIKELSRTLERHQFNNNKPIELLVLSACETATGDERALLGLAGFALKSGAASTVGTLWIVNDFSTAKLMIDFYQLLAAHPGVTKAEALRQAQLNLLKENRYHIPYFWAPFVLIGNWL